MTDTNSKHPADALSLALDRSVGLLASVGDLYDPSHERFTGGEAFVAHALATVSALIVDAKEALSDLHFCCDLTLLDTPDQRAMTMDLGHEVHADMPADVEILEPAAMQHDFIEAVDAAPAHDDEFAQSYLELLRKLTAAEVFAAEQQALSVPGSTTELLPLLKSLREDLQKLHSAA